MVGLDVNNKYFELDEETYKHAQVYVDNWPGANEELKQLKSFGADMKAEVGEVILGNSPKPGREQLTVFQSLGKFKNSFFNERIFMFFFSIKTA